jgi:hypothetical protein
MDLMARKSKTQQLVEGSLGQHLALSVAAHLARTQLVPDPLNVYDGRHLSDTVDVVASALAKVAPLYILDTKTGTQRELTPVELEGATMREAATKLVLKDGRTLSSVSIKRADLRQAIAILKAIGIPGLAGQEETAENRRGQAPERRQAPLEVIGEISQLLRPPLIRQQVERANDLLVSLARNAPHGRVANLAMQLMNAVLATKGDDADAARVNMALAKLRAAAEELNASERDSTRRG